MYIEKAWRIISTRRTYEQRVVKVLRHKGIQSFCPCFDYKFVHEGRIHSEKRLLFPCILFVYVDAAEINLVKQTKGFNNFLYWLNAPVLIPHKEISRIYGLVNSFSNLQVEKCEINFSRPDTNVYRDSDETVHFFYTMGYKITTRKEFGLSEQKKPSLHEPPHKLPAFSLNNSLNLASI